MDKCKCKTPYVESRTPEAHLKKIAGLAIWGHDSILENHTGMSHVLRGVLH